MFCIKSNGDLKYLPTCILNASKLTIVDTLVDTGAMCTCYSANDVDKELKEEQFSTKDCILVRGFTDKQNPVVFYKYKVKQFTVGNIDLGSQFIWLTFDKRSTDNVLGMDILRQVSFLQYADSDTLYFFKYKIEMESYISGIISRKCYRLQGGTYCINYSGTVCHFDKHSIKQDNTGRQYIMLGKQICYLSF